MAKIIKTIRYHKTLLFLLAMCLGYGCTLHGMQQNDEIEEEKEYIGDQPQDKRWPNRKLTIVVNSKPRQAVAWHAKSIQESKAVETIIRCLQYWQAPNDSKLKNIFSDLNEDNNYKYIVDAYHHVLDVYLNGKDSRSAYRYVHQRAREAIKCTFATCACYIRNQRKREQEAYKAEEDREYLFLSDLLDTIHVYFLHGYDAGYRYLAKKRTVATNNTVEKPNEDRGVAYDDTIEALKKWKRDGVKKWKRDDKRGSRYLTTKLIGEEKPRRKVHFDLLQLAADHKDQEERTAGIYYFGVRLYYWDNYKDREIEDPWHPEYIQKDLYVRAAYQSFKDETLAFNISINTWNQKMYVASQLLSRSSILKKPKTTSNVLGMHRGDGMSVDHILAILFYTNFTTLSSEFRKSFRCLSHKESLAHIIVRNSGWHYLSKYLREVVEIFGEEIGCSSLQGGKSRQVDKGSFYHGMSEVLFGGYSVHFYGPLSTSRQLEVAMPFAPDSGIVVTLKESAGWADQYLRFFNVSLVSCFAAEDERLFIGGQRALQIAAIRTLSATPTLKKHSNTEPFMHTLFVMPYMIRGECLYGINTKASDEDGALLGQLIARKKGLPQYIRDTWDTFRLQQEKIHIRMSWMYTDYKAFEKHLIDPACPNLLMFDRIIDLFPNVTEIKCTNTDCNGTSPFSYSPNMIDGRFIVALQKRLRKIDQPKLTKIIITTAKHKIKHLMSLNLLRSKLKSNKEFQQLLQFLSDNHCDADFILEAIDIGKIRGRATKRFVQNVPDKISIEMSKLNKIPAMPITKDLIDKMKNACKVFKLSDWYIGKGSTTLVISKTPYDDFMRKMTSMVHAARPSYEFNYLDMSIFKQLKAGKAPHDKQEAWRKFTQQKKIIRLDTCYIKRYYALFARRLLLEKIVDLFPNIKKFVCIAIDYTGLDEKTKSFTSSIVDEDFIKDLKNTLHKIEKKRHSKLKKIIFKTYWKRISHDIDAKPFRLLGWKIEKERETAEYSETWKNPLYGTHNTIALTKLETSSKSSIFSRKSKRQILPDEDEFEEKEEKEVDIQENIKGALSTKRWGM